MAVPRGFKTIAMTVATWNVGEEMCTRLESKSSVLDRCFFKIHMYVKSLKISQGLEIRI
jgi:hypothetical protein